MKLCTLKDHPAQKEGYIRYKKAMQREEHVTYEKANLYAVLYGQSGSLRNSRAKARESERWKFQKACDRDDLPQLLCEIHVTQRDVDVIFSVNLSPPPFTKLQSGTTHEHVHVRDVL